MLRVDPAKVDAELNDRARARSQKEIALLALEEAPVGDLCLLEGPCRWLFPIQPHRDPSFLVRDAISTVRPAQGTSQGGEVPSDPLASGLSHWKQES